MATQFRLVVVDDQPAERVERSDSAGVREFARALDCQYTRISWSDVAHDTAAWRDADLMLALARPPFAAVGAALSCLHAQASAVPILLVMPADTDEAALQSVARIADDFMFFPLQSRELSLRARRLLHANSTTGEVYEQLVGELAVAQLVGRSPKFLRAIEPLPRFARTDVPVLITGETGTGKELCARALHQLGPRRALPFVAIDCGSIPEQLFESELFGHTRGAFTGADRERKGLIAVADGGSLFLDEIDALSLSAQAKLLRFLQERSYRPVGADRFAQTDVKIIAATNRDLASSVRDKTFRADLYFRLNVLHVHLPPLRERSSDIAVLARALLERSQPALAAGPKTLTNAAVRVLERHAWPGNIRELSNVVQRAAVLSESHWILPSHLTFTDCGAHTESPVLPVSATGGGGAFRSARAAAVAEFERRYIEELLRKHHGNVTQAAREARQDRRAFGRYIKKYQIDRTAL